MRQAVHHLPPLGNVLQEGHELFLRRRTEFIGADHDLDRAHGADPVHPGVAQYLLHRCLTDAALGHVDDAFEGQVIIGLTHQTQVGNGVADFPTLIETRPAKDLVGQPDVDHPFFDRAHHRRRAHEDGKILVVPALTMQTLDFVSDVTGFFVAIWQPTNMQRLTGPIVGK